MTRIQFGFCMPADKLDKTRRATFSRDLNRALNLVTGHFDSAWIIDHLQFGEDDVLEGFTALSYLAALHPQLKFGHTVLCQSFRNPALLAKMGATLHFLSGGRFILGLGAGWHAEEYRAYGYDFPPDRVRVQQLDETLQIIQALWTQTPATFATDGEVCRLVECVFDGDKQLSAPGRRVRAGLRGHGPGFLHGQADVGRRLCLCAESGGSASPGRWSCERREG